MHKILALSAYRALSAPRAITAAIQAASSACAGAVLFVPAVPPSGSFELSRNGTHSVQVGAIS
jgi:hypothetical protein